MPPDRRQGNERQLAYLRELAGHMGVNIARWRLRDFCEEGDYTRLIQDRNAINRIFMEKVRRGAEDGEEEVALPEGFEDRAARFVDESLSVIEMTSRRVLTEDIRRLESSREGLVRRLRDIEEQLRIKDLQQCAKFSDTKRAQLVHEMTEVLKGGWYHSPLFGDSWVAFLTGDCVLSERSSAAGLDVSKNMGTFSVKLQLGSHMTLRVYPYHGNLGGGRGLFHPHVSRDGDVCWGSSTGVLQQAFRDYDIKTVFDMLSAVLNTYNPGNPYEELANFERAFSRSSSMMSASPHRRYDSDRGRASGEETT